VLSVTWTIFSFRCNGARTQQSVDHCAATSARCRYYFENDKCQFSEECVKFLGHVINRHGVHADPEKIKAISEMTVLHDISAVRQSLDVANQVAKSVQNLAGTSLKPLRILILII